MEAVQADVIARYHALVGNEVYFLSGTDDNALKNVLKAEEEGEPVRSYVDRHAQLFSDLLKDLSVSNNDFIRTSADSRHARGAQKLWKAFKPEDITKKSYSGLYCVGCEEFKTDKDLVNGECPEHPGRKLEEVAEENYFFKLGNYQDRLIQAIETDTVRIIPTSRKNEVLSFLRGGLEDISISRSRARARDWGVPVPGDEGQVMYVWVDALSNYINALGYADEGDAYQKFWAAEESVRIHAIGKGITRFHAIYWPAFLLSAGVPLPTHLFVHGYVISGGQKMSKTLGNVISPTDFIKEYGADALRYFIVREMPVFEDSDFTKERFHEAYTGNLANGLGNLVARVMKLAETHLEMPIDRPGADDFPKEYTDSMDRYDINGAAHFVWGKIQSLDKTITDTKPFAVVKENPTEGKKLISEAVTELYKIAQILNPLLPTASEIIKRAILENKMPPSLFPRKEIV